MDDLISRQAAIDTLHVWFRDGFEEDRWWNSTHVLAAIEGLPSVQPERKTGKWISTDNGWDGEYFVCSVCGCPWTLIEGSPEDNGMNFCPNCGAYMRGEQK